MMGWWAKARGGRVNHYWVYVSGEYVTLCGRRMIPYGPNALGWKRYAERTCEKCARRRRERNDD